MVIADMADHSPRLLSCWCLRRTCHRGLSKRFSSTLADRAGTSSERDLDQKRHNRTFTSGATSPIGSNNLETGNQMLKNRVVLAALAMSIAASGALAAAGPAQASTPNSGSAVRVVTAAATLGTITIPNPGTIAPDDSCWD
jgi:hypothetical protein